MPLPKPKKNEDKSSFMSRCMSNQNINKEFKTNSQKIAVCEAQWKNK